MTLGPPGRAPAEPHGGAGGRPAVLGIVLDDARRDVDQRRHEVPLAVWCANQRGQVTAPGTAVVFLPTRGRMVERPAPDPDGMVRHGPARFSAAG